MSTYRDHQGIKRKVRLVEDLNRSWLEQGVRVTPHFNDEPVKAASAWKEFLKLATAHLPNCDYRYCHGEKYRVTVFMPDDYMEMGELSMEIEPQYQEPIFYVTSHTIENRRYCPYDNAWNYRTRHTVSLDKAVKNARKHLRPNSLADVANTTHNQLKSAYGTQLEHANSKFRRSIRELGFQTYDHINGRKTPYEALNEMISSSELGLVKYSDKLSDMLTTFIKAREELENKSKLDTALLCWVRNDWDDKPIIETHKVKVHNQHSVGDTSRGMDCYNNNFCGVDKQRYKDDIPDDIEHKVSVLNILDNDEYVEEVGYKCSNSVYYIFGEE
jgi:hypothetical protein